MYDNEDIILEFLTKTEDGKIKTENSRYVHGPGIDEPLAIERKGETFFYHADGLGSVTALTDRRQRVVESYDYCLGPGLEFLTICKLHRLKKEITFDPSYSLSQRLIRLRWKII